jgi:hypothetical protein
LIQLDDALEGITVSDLSGNLIGEIDIQEIEYDIYSDHKIIHMYLDKQGSSYLRCGIGRECLRFFRDMAGATLVAERNTGMRHSDGSHLTGDAPSFVAKMRRESPHKLS